MKKLTFISCLLLSGCLAGAMAANKKQPIYKDAKAPIEGAGVPFPDAAFRLKNSRLEQLGKDFLIESEVEYPCLPESWKKSEQ